MIFIVLVSGKRRSVGTISVHDKCRNGALPHFIVYRNSGYAVLSRRIDPVRHSTLTVKATWLDVDVYVKSDFNEEIECDCTTTVLCLIPPQQLERCFKITGMNDSTVL